MLKQLPNTILTLALTIGLFFGGRAMLAISATAFATPANTMQEEEEHRSGHGKMTHTEHRVRDRKPSPGGTPSGVTRLALQAAGCSHKPSHFAPTRQSIIAAALSGQLRC
jgi:hypothetical protein